MATITAAEISQSHSSLLWDTSTLGTNGRPIGMASVVPTMSQSTFSGHPSHEIGVLASVSVPTRAPTNTSTHPLTTPTSAMAAPSAVTETTPPRAKDNHEPMSPLWIGIIVLCIFILVAVVALVAFIWIRRKKSRPEKLDESQSAETMVTAQHPATRQPELSWMSGPTLIPESNTRWSARTLVPPEERHSRVGHGALGVPPRTMQSIPERSASRHSEPQTVRPQDRELPSTPGGSTPLVTPVSPVSPARRGYEGIRGPTSPNGDRESYRPSPVSPMEDDGIYRVWSMKEV